MTNRDRMLAVFRGGDLDRVPFIQYDQMEGPNEPVWAEVGRENLGILRWVGVGRREHPNCRVESVEYVENGLRAVRNTLITPIGQLTQEKLFEPALNTAATRKHYVQTPDDYRILLAFLRDVRITEDLSGIEQAFRDLGDNGLPLVALDRTPYQQLWVQWVCLEDLCLHLVDCPDIIEEVTNVLGEQERQLCRIAATAARRFDLPFIDVPDNITSPVIGDRLFRKYCVPYYNELAELLEGTNTPVIVHMDGDLKPLAAAIRESRVRGLDSFSPQPDNDTSVAEALQLWPGMRLMINFPSSVHLASAERIYAQARQMLEEGGHTRQIWIQVSENPPPGAWHRSYPAIIQAIKDFGKP